MERGPSVFNAFKAEFGHIFRDRQVVLILVCSLVFYSFFYPFPYQAEVVRDIPVVVVDQDNTALSRTLVRMTRSAETVRVVDQVPEFEAAKDWVYSRKANGVLVIPNEFQRRLLRGEQASVALYADAGSFITYKQVFSGIYAASKTLSAGVEIKRLRASGMAADQAMAMRDPLALSYVKLFNPAGGYGSYVIPIVFFLLLQQTLVMGMGMLGGTARETGNMAYFAGSSRGENPVSAAAGKGMAHFCIYAVHSLYCFGIMARVYQFPHQGAIQDEILFVIPFLLSVIFGSMALATFFRQREIAIFVAVFTALPLMFMSRVSWPSEMIPDYLEKALVFIPCIPGVEGFLRISAMGAGLDQVRGAYVTLWILALVYFCLASLRFWQLQRRAH